MKKSFFRINQYIQADKVRVVDDKGEQVGVLKLNEALQQAQQKGLDLVEVAPKAQPPVCKIIDFKKFKFLESKKKQAGQKKAKKVGLKEIRLSLFMAPNDFAYRLKRAKEFLKQGHKVKFGLLFRGRQITKRELGFELFNKAIEELGFMAKVDSRPKIVGKRLGMSLSPNQGSKNEKENKEKQV